jgi:hypothetical protein
MAGSPRVQESPSPRAGTAEPSARRTIFSAFRAAALELWGQAGLDAIGAKMEPECRAATVDAVVLAGDWLPERYVMSWYEAAWEGPCQRHNKPFLEFIDRMMDHGFGRVRKFLLGIASPSMMVGKAASLWRHDHTDGHFTISMTNPGTVEITLRDHAYVETPLSRLAIAEIYRYAFSLCRVNEVTMTHSLEATGSLLVRLTVR